MIPTALLDLVKRTAASVYPLRVAWAEIILFVLTLPDKFHHAVIWLRSDPGKWLVVSINVNVGCLFKHLSPSIDGSRY